MPAELRFSGFVAGEARCGRTSEWPHRVLLPVLLPTPRILNVAAGILYLDAHMRAMPFMSSCEPRARAGVRIVGRREEQTKTLTVALL